MERPTIIVAALLIVGGCGDTRKCSVTAECFAAEVCIEQRCEVAADANGGIGDPNVSLRNRDVCDADQMRRQSLEYSYCAVQCEAGNYCLGDPEFRCADGWCVDNRVAHEPLPSDACTESCGEIESCLSRGVHERRGGACQFTWNQCGDVFQRDVYCWPNADGFVCECRQDYVVTNLFEVSGILCEDSYHDEFNEECGWQI